MQLATGLAVRELSETGSRTGGADAKKAYEKSLHIALVQMAAELEAMHRNQVMHSERIADLQRALRRMKRSSRRGGAHSSIGRVPRVDRR